MWSCMTSEVLFFDSYAVVEILQANPKYKPFEEVPFIINQFVLAEVLYYAVREKKNPHELLRRLHPRVKAVRPDCLLQAMQYRFQHRKQKLSMTDCVSYLQAKALGILFLTGDEQFRKKENVEFVK